MSTVQEGPAGASANQSAVRGVRLGDLMLLIAAIALAFVATRGCLADMILFQHNFNHPANWFVLASPTVISVSLAMFAICLSRAGRQDLFRKPGVVAYWVIVLNVVFRLAVELMLQSHAGSLRGLDIRAFANYGFYWHSCLDVGGWILTAWIALALSERWESDRGWIDRTGRVFGAFWILAFLANRFPSGLWLW